MHKFQTCFLAVVFAPLFSAPLHAVGAGQCSGRSHTLDTTRCTAPLPRVGPPQPDLRGKVAQRSKPAMDRLSGDGASGGSSSGTASTAQPPGRIPLGSTYQKQNAPKTDTRGAQPPKFDLLDKVIGGARVRF